MRSRLLRAAAAVVIVALCAGLGLCVRRWGFGLMRVAGTSMSDTLRDGDIALVTRFDYRSGRGPELGDVVECRFPNRADTYIKRVMGLPGQRVTLHDVLTRVDGAVISEPYVSSPSGDFEILLREDEYLLLGDNRAESYDSRMPDMGPVHADALLGRVRFVVWPPNRLRKVD